MWLGNVVLGSPLKMKDGLLLNLIQASRGNHLSLRDENNNLFTQRSLFLTGKLKNCK